MTGRDETPTAPTERRRGARTAHRRPSEGDARIVVEGAHAQPTSRVTGSVRVLVTNDDGVEAAGISHLAAALAREFDVTIAGPDRDWSGSGTGIGRVDPVAGVPMRRVEVDAGLAFALDGPPGLAVMAAALGAFGEPFDLVVSGVNAGINTGHSVIHSGTVGAALTARTFGAHGIAVSTPPADPWRWSAAAEIGLAVTRWIARSEREPTALNVNVPGVDLVDIRGLRHATLDHFGYFRVAVADEIGQTVGFEVTSEREQPPQPGSDTRLLRDGFATITELGPVVTSSGALPDDLDQIWAPCH